VNRARTHYLNADFDLGLRPRPRRHEQPGLVRQVRELSAQALIGAAADDAALLRVPVPEEFLDYLEQRGLETPRLLVHPEIDPDSYLRPFGWSAEAIELNRRHRRPEPHPAADCIARVNSRSFTLELEQEIAPHERLGRVIESRDELTAFLSRAAAASEWIIKSEHGNSGLANRRLRASTFSDADRRFVDGLFAEDDRLVIEPWLTRERDWCVVFDVPFVAATLRIHETTCTRDGALIGALFSDESDLVWSAELTRAAERIASRLADAGYFGPVCLDAFSWHDGDRLRLRPLVDLNCRFSMSDGAWRLWRRIAPDRSLFYRFFNRRKLDLPSTLPQAVSALGDLHYDPQRRHGILFVSPLRFGTEEETWHPTKLALVFVAEHRTELLTLERNLRTKFES